MTPRPIYYAWILLLATSHLIRPEDVFQDCIVE
jgi:hypothetical protein